VSEAETDKRSRRERRAEAKGTAQDEIKDRNQRLRAEAGSRRKSERKKELSAARAEGLATAERVDDALVRGADGASRLLKDHFKWLQWVFVLGVAGSMAYLVYDYRRGVDREAQGHEVAEALDAVSGRITSATPVTPSDRNLVDTRPEFESAEKKLEAALGHFAELAKSKDPELRLLGQLGRASVLYDQGKFADARGIYEEAFKNPRASELLDLRVRAAEGIVLCHEAEGRLGDAAKAASVLADLGGQAAELGALHGARIAFQEGDVEKAKTALSTLLEKLEKKRAADAQPGYIEAAARELQKSVDPTRAAAAAAAAAAASGGISPEQLEELKRQFEAMQKSAPPAPAPLDAPPVGLPGSELDDPLNAAPADAPAPATPQLPAPQVPAPQAPRSQGAAPAPAAPQSAPAAPKKAAPVAPAPAAPVAPAPAAPAPAAPPAEAPAGAAE